MKLKNLVFTALLVFLFVEVLIIFPGKLEKMREADVPPPEVTEENPPPENNSVLAEQKMKGVHLVESQSGKRDWELFSERAEGSQGSGSWNLKKVRVLFYNKEQVEFTVVGDEGSLDAKTKDLSIRGNVVTQSANGYSFRTSSIFYYSQKRRIESPQEVVMRGPADKDGEGLLVRGKRMTVNVDESKMEILDQVRAQKDVNGGKKLEIMANGAEFSGKNRQARFLGNVTMNYEKMKVQGPEAKFVYQKDQDLISSIEVMGGVKVSDVNKFASSETLHLDVLANQFTFRGKPKVVQNDDELTGDEIIFLEGGKRVKVEKVRARVEGEQQ